MSGVALRKRTRPDALCVGFTVISARKDGERIGWAEIVHAYHDLPHVMELFTEPGHRRQGVGRQLMEGALAEFGSLCLGPHPFAWDSENGALDLDALVAFYQRLGFRPAPDDEDPLHMAAG